MKSIFDTHPFIRQALFIAFLFSSPLSASDLSKRLWSELNAITQSTKIKESPNQMIVGDQISTTQSGIEKDQRLHKSLKNEVITIETSRLPIKSKQNRLRKRSR